MNRIIIDENICKKDGICGAVCPLGIINTNEGVPSLSETNGDICIECGHCVAACPHGALSLDTMKTGECVPVDKSLLPDNRQLEHLFKSRRSVRAFREMPVETDTIRKIIHTAAYAPTGGNRQQVEWTAVTSKEKLHGIAEGIIEMIRVMIRDGHPLVETYALERTVSAWESGDDPVLRKAPLLLIAHAPLDNAIGQTDSVIALTQAELAAHSLGVGSCWAGMFMLAVAAMPALAGSLGFPEGNACYGALMMGYPRYTYHRLPGRKEPDISWIN